MFISQFGWVLCFLSILSFHSLFPQVKKSAAAELKRILSHSDIAEAVTVFKGLSNSDYSFIEKEFLELGEEELEKDHISKSLVVYRLAAEIFPDSWKAQQYLGEAYNLKGNHFNQALDGYQKALTLIPNNPERSLAYRRIQGLRSSSQAETPMTELHPPGENTGQAHTLGRNRPASILRSLHRESFR